MDHSVIAVLLGEGFAIIMLLAKVALGNNKDNFKDLKDALAENVKVTNQNTLAITKLMVTIESIEDKLDIVGELRRDVDRLGAKVRSSKGN